MPTLASDKAIVKARQWYDIYRQRGYQPLPSDPTDKKPLVRFAHLWTEPTDEDLFDQFPTTNLQIICGCPYRLAVIDLDGIEGEREWATWPPLGKKDRPWISSCSAGSRHLWFSLPRDLKKLPSGRLWGEWDDHANEGLGGWKKHIAIERLGDRKLVMAPPSIHPKKGRMYRFEHGYSPLTMGLYHPMVMPDWLINYPLAKPPKGESDESNGEGNNSAGVVRCRRVDHASHPLDTAAVLAAIHDKAGIARSWGLRFAGQSSGRDGWVSVHAVGREDRNPSASFHLDSGHYTEFRDGESLSFFDLGARLGVYATWQDCRADLARQHGLIAD